VDPLDEPELLDPDPLDEPVEPELDEPELVDGVLVDVDGEVGVDVEGGVVDVDGEVGVDVEGGVVDVEGLVGFKALFAEDSRLGFEAVNVLGVVVDNGVDVNVGVGLLRLTLMGLKVVWLGFNTNCSQDWDPPESTDAQTWAFWIWTFTGTITVTGMFKLVFVIPIRASTCEYRFESPLGEVVNTTPDIFASLLIYDFGLVGADAVVAEAVPVLFPWLCLVRSMLPPFALRGWQDCDPLGNDAQSCKSSIFALAGTVAVIGSFIGLPLGPRCRLTLTVIFLVEDVLLAAPEEDGAVVPCVLVVVALLDFEYLIKNFSPPWPGWFCIVAAFEYCTMVADIINNAATDNTAPAMILLSLFIKTIVPPWNNIIYNSSR
jgi:hypothetical protein